jgi:uncharacterized protein (TIGR04255 family)
VFDLPDVSPYRLRRAPLVQAVAQVRYPLLAQLSTMPGIATVQEGLRDRLPFMSRHITRQFSVQPVAGVQFEAGNPDGWDFTDDSGHSLWISPGMTTLTADHRYSGIETFADLFQYSLKTVVEAGELRRCDRLGIEYISVAKPRPGDGAAWKRWFQPAICGWPASIVEGRLDATASRTQITGSTDGDFREFNSEPQALIAHGFFPEGTVLNGIPPVTLDEHAYVFDLDCFVDAPQPFIVDSIVSQFRVLHSQMDRFFRWALTDEGADFFGLEER